MCGVESIKQAERQIKIDLLKRRLQLVEDGRILKTYPVAVGADKTPSPVGVYNIIHKARWGGAFGTRWMGLDVPWGTYGIHGTNNPGSIGKAVSHGCIRMYNRDVEEVYEQVAAGTTVTILGPVAYRISVQGSRGNVVLLIQQKLSEQGYYQGRSDGIFSPELALAVSEFQTDRELPITGQVNRQDLSALGINLT